MKISDYNSKHINEFNRLYRIAHNIKITNVKFEDYFDNIQKYKIKMLKINDRFRGYLFYKSNRYSHFFNDRITIDEIFIEKNYNTPQNYYNLIESINKGLFFKRYKYAEFIFDKNNRMYNIISKLNLIFEKKMIEMKIDLYTEKKVIVPEKIEFIIFKKGIDEKKRTIIQNSIFSDTPGHIDCDIDDIIHEEKQYFFIEDGCIFLYCDGQIAGYSQIIIEKNNIIKPTIVNFGIDKKYRGLGLSIPLLNYTLNKIKSKGFSEAYLTVDASNKVAFNLYKKAGFNDINTKNFYVYKFKGFHNIFHF